MNLPGTLGPYSVERELGRGGMGVVYLGRDPRLDRPVAIKVVPDALALNPENLARFEREAKLLAAVNHPNIASIYGVEDAGGRRVLVMEYVAGETLGERLQQGPLPIAEALDVGRQIASAIEAAHEAGIVHRDLKPGNVKITPDGIVKVLDFGLAKGGVAANADLALSPTVTFSPTMAGVILGTAGYMSPEQARGKPVDRRADIWAFGVVLFECLAGRRAFDGETVSDTIARILEREPAWDALPAATPVRVRALLRRCLEKDLKKRQRDMGDVRIELDEALAERSSSSVSHAAPAGRAGIRWGLAALLVALGVAGGFAARSLLDARQSAANGTPLSLAVSVPSSLRAGGVGFTKDGASLIVVARTAGGPGTAEQVERVFLRRLSGFEFTPIAGTEGFHDFDLSPDGKWIAVVRSASDQSTDWLLEKVSIDGSSPPMKIADWEREWDDFIWLRDGDLLIRTTDPAHLIRVPSGGGPQKPRVKLDLGKAGDLWLERELPDSTGVLSMLEHFGPRGYQRDLWFLDPTTGKGHVIVEDAAVASYSEDLGHLLFARGPSIMAVPFDSVTYKTRGDVVALMEGLRSAAGGTGGYELSKAGHLVFRPGGRLGVDRRVVAVTPSQAVTAFNGDARAYEEYLVTSADGRRAAVVIPDARSTYETYVVEADGQRARRVATSIGADMVPGAFSPDGAWLALERFAKDKDDGIYVQRTDGSGAPKRLLARAPEDGLEVHQWTGGGIVIDRTTNNLTDIMLLPVSKDGEPGALRPLRQTAADEDEGRISPDGTLIVFDSEESGRDELYVARLSGGTIVGQPVPLAVGGGLPRWSRDGRHVYFRMGSPARVMVSTIEATPSLRAGTPTVAWDLRALRILSNGWDILPDGRLVGIQRGANEDDITSYHLVLNWIDGVKAKLGVK